MHFYFFSMSRYFILSLLLCFFSISSSIAQVKLPAFFSSHMIFQQKSQAKVWGWDCPYSTIFLKGSWGAKSKTVADEHGRWSTTISTPAAGGPFSLSIKGSTKILLKDILIGEVWFCSGQSNMYMPLKGYSNQPVEGANSAILKSSKYLIRYFQQEKSAALSPKATAAGKWFISNTKNSPDFSAVAYFFAQQLSEALNVPIGIIQSSVGGSPIAAWLSESARQQLQLPSAPQKFQSDDLKKQRKWPTVLYNSMIHPFEGFTIKGMLWYQGESDVTAPSRYASCFSTLIQDYRQQWEMPEMPFYFVQIAPYGYLKANAGFLREAQAQVAETVKNTGMVVTTDLGEKAHIHPRKKQAVGQRLAYWALVHQYGFEGLQCKSPKLDKIKKDGEHVLKLFFQNARYGLSTFGGSTDGFSIAGKDRHFYPAKVVFNKDRSLSLSSDLVEHPVAVRYCFSSAQAGNFYNNAHLPLQPFRTDQ
ncbi:9-O-acetylesterase (plasmid) [Persicobacter psychrovividus]|uniref:9-O-acetylesterase n=2 Tax=Persicobacter psychrovividus TaxID=387638 RepID=A0ABN6LCT5_9BACT|nr:9-O-acetylesterase [Persicobacter psychrovividus]